MSSPRSVLLLGGTGRTGRQVLRHLLARGVHVRAIVRSPGKVPPEAAQHAGVDVIEGELLALGDADLKRHVQGCDAVVSCLGHVLDLRGIFGPPRDLVTRATARLCQAIRSLSPAEPVKFVLMSSVSVNRAGGLDTRTPIERSLLGVLCGALPPALDNQRAADHLQEAIGTRDPHVEWVAIRPDTLLAGEVTPYAVREGLVSSLFAPEHTNMANVAHFIGDLVTDPAVWAEWRFKFPVIVNAVPAQAEAAQPA